jgi:molybdopterin-guanine dinucleotide biosynthesis protein A
MKSAVILAGGKSTRMGIDKCTVLFRGKPLIFWPYSVLKNLVDEVIISVSMGRNTSALGNFLGSEVKIVADEIADMGPILGMLSSFKSANGEYVACSPCDSPFLKEELYLKLFEHAKGADGAVPEIDGYWEPLHGVYKRDVMIEAIEKVVDLGKMKPTDVYDFLDIRKLTHDAVTAIDPDLVSFVNINSFEDLTRASSISIKVGNSKNR